MRKFTMQVGWFPSLGFQDIVEKMEVIRAAEAFGCSKYT